MTEPKRVLVVDDDPLVRKAFSRLLSGRFLVDQAEDGRRAIDLMRQTQYAAVVSDVNMPNLDGRGLLDEAVREGLADPGDFLFMTSLPDSPESDVIRAAGGRVEDKTSAPVVLREAVREMADRDG